MFTLSFHSILNAERSAYDFQCRNKPHTHGNLYHSSILKKIKRFFSPVWDNSTFKRSFHSILHAKRSAYDFQRRNKPRAHANRNHSSILSKIKRYFYPVWDMSTFTISFHSILHAERSAYDFQCRNKPRNTQLAIISRFWRRLIVISIPFEIFRCLHFLFTLF